MSARRRGRGTSRGVDTYHNFEDEQPPDADMSVAARAFHARVTGVQEQVLMRETGARCEGNDHEDVPNSWTLPAYRPRLRTSSFSSAPTCQRLQSGASIGRLSHRPARSCAGSASSTRPSTDMVRCTQHPQAPLRARSSLCLQIDATESNLFGRPTALIEA